MLPSLEHLDYLECVHRNGSVAAAARELNVAQSTVYRRIALLEERFGASLLSRGEGLTPLGEELATLAGSAQSKVAATLRKAMAKNASLQGTVTLTTATGFAPLLSQVLASLTSTHPGLCVEVHVSDREGLSVRDGEADIALSLVPNPPSSLVGKKIMQVRYGVFARSELTHEKTPPWVVLSRPMHGTPQARWERDHVPGEQVAVRTGSQLAFIEFVRQGIGLGVLPERLGTRYMELTRIKQPRSLSTLTLPVWLLTHPELRTTPRVRVVMDAIEEFMTRKDIA